MKILVTGGLGYIGSETSLYLLKNGYDVVILDNLSNSKIDVLDKIKELAGKDITFYQGDMNDLDFLDNVFKKEKIEGVIDFAAYKAVGESVAKPVEYYINNVSSVLTLLTVMKKYDVKKLVFSSSATVYGDPDQVPIPETARTGGTTNPYGTSKLMVERILKDLYASDNSFNIAILRYFNPIGADPSGLLGENPNGIPANLIPYVSKVATGKLEYLSIYGDDYDTKDGTGVRDYIHVVDLAIGHIKALDKLNKDGSGMHIYNLGTGTGYSVLDIVKAFESVNNVKVPYKIVARRPGDIAECYSDATKAKEELGWEATKSLEDMLRDSFNFEKMNKN